MITVGIIQSIYKGFSFYIPKENNAPILRDLINQLSKQKDSIKHFFFYFDHRFDCRFRLFIHSDICSEDLYKSFKSFLKPYASDKQFELTQNQFFSTFPPFSIVPFSYIEPNDEIYILIKNTNSIHKFLENLCVLISIKNLDFDFENKNEKLEFILELLLAGLNFCQVSTNELTKCLKKVSKGRSISNKYLASKYGKTIEDNKESIIDFRKSLLKIENEDNLMNVFWKENLLIKDYYLMISLVFKVLNIETQQQLYCLYLLLKTSEY